MSGAAGTRLMRARWDVAHWRDGRIRAMLTHSVHNRVTGTARTLMALATAASLLFTPVEHLFYVAGSRPSGRLCEGVNGDIGLFCLTPAGQVEWARWAAIAALLVIASGWRPRWTAIPHWWISLSFFSTSNVMEGGDQVAAVVTLLLIPVCLTDPRRLHWDAPPAPGTAPATGQIVAHLALRLIWLQACVLYLQASVAKLGGEEWRDGTSVWYWTTSGAFGAPGSLHGLMEWTLAHSWAVTAATWGTLAVEFALAWCLFGRLLPRRVTMFCAAVLHASIAVLFGLPAFSLIMTALLLLYLARPGDPPTVRRSFLTFTQSKQAVRNQNVESGGGIPVHGGGVTVRTDSRGGGGADPGDRNSAAARPVGAQRLHGDTDPALDGQR